MQVLRQLADLVEEDRTVLGDLELAGLRGHCAGERAFLVPEQLGLEKGVDDGGAVDADERLVSRAVAVNDARDQLLAGAAIALDEHGSPAGGDAPYVLEQLLHGG